MTPPSPPFILVDYGTARTVSAVDRDARIAPGTIPAAGGFPGTAPDTVS